MINNNKNNDNSNVSIQLLLALNLFNNSYPSALYSKFGK